MKPPEGWREIILDGEPSGNFTRQEWFMYGEFYYLHKLDQGWVVETHVMSKGIENPTFRSHPVPTLEEAVRIADVLLEISGGKGEYA